MNRYVTMSTGLAVLALAGGTVAVSTSAGAAEPEAKAVAAAPCKKLASANRDTVRLWYCNGTQGTARGYHAQALLYSGGKVTLRSSTGWTARTKKATHGGVLAQWYNTATFWEGQPGRFRACTGVCTGLAG
jgi:hypothetical protein